MADPAAFCGPFRNSAGSAGGHLGGFIVVRRFPHGTISLLLAVFGLLVEASAGAQRNLSMFCLINIYKSINTRFHKICNEKTITESEMNDFVSFICWKEVKREPPLK